MAAAALAGIAIYIGLGIRELSSTQQVIISASGTALVLLFWGLTHRTPRRPRDKIGILVSFISDDDEENRRVKTDFVENLRRLLESNLSSNFALVVLPDYAASRVMERGEARKFLDKSRCHFILYGRASRRLVQGVDTHALSLEAGVRHAEVPIAVSQNLAADFRQALPSRVLFPDDNSIFAFDVTAALVHISIRFAVGVAAFLSGDAILADRLLAEVEFELKSTKGVSLPVANAVVEWLRRLYQSWLDAVYDRYFATHNTAYLPLLDEIAEKLLDRDPRNYPALLMKAMTEFMLRRDVSSARDLVNRARNPRDTTWLYSRAFLAAYEGDLSSANDDYRRASRGPLINPNVPIQTEEFIQIILEEEPDKEQLYFCLGLINYNIKEDYRAAIRDFSKFLESAFANSHPVQRELAEELLRRARGRNEPNNGG